MAYIMPKKCIICGAGAKYVIKGTSDYYCEDCADENFSDITLLEKVDETKKLDEDADEAVEESEEEPEEESEEDSKKKSDKEPEEEPEGEGSDDDSDFDEDDESGSEEE